MTQLNLICIFAKLSLTAYLSQEERVQKDTFSRTRHNRLVPEVPDPVSQVIRVAIPREAQRSNMIRSGLQTTIPSPTTRHWKHISDRCLQPHSVCVYLAALQTCPGP